MSNNFTAFKVDKFSDKQSASTAARAVSDDQHVLGPERLLRESLLHKWQALRGEEPIGIDFNKSIFRISIFKFKQLF
jgi:hypothetical protein